MEYDVAKYPNYLLRVSGIENSVVIIMIKKRTGNLFLPKKTFADRFMGWLPSPLIGSSSMNDIRRIGVTDWAGKLFRHAMFCRACAAVMKQVLHTAFVDFF